MSYRDRYTDEVDEMPYLPFAVIMLIIIMIIIVISALCLSPTKEQQKELLKLKQYDNRN